MIENYYTQLRTLLHPNTSLYSGCEISGLGLMSTTVMPSL